MLPTFYDAQNNQLQQKSSNASSAEVKTFHWLGVGGKSFVPAFRRQRQEGTTSQGSLDYRRRPCFKNGKEGRMGRDGEREGEKEEPMKERMGGMKSENEV